MNGKIETWFPKSVYIAEGVRCDLLTLLENEIESLCLSEPTTRNTSQYVHTSARTHNILHLERPSFQELSEDIMKHVKHYASSLGYDDQFISQLRVGKMWYNISYKGDFIFPHSHPGSFFSGAYYVKANPGNQIVFYDRLDHYAEQPMIPNHLSYNDATYDCVPGRLLVFRSDFVHGVPVQDFEGEKITISFNVIHTNI